MQDSQLVRDAIAESLHASEFRTLETSTAARRLYRRGKEGFLRGDDWLTQGALKYNGPAECHAFHAALAILRRAALRVQTDGASQLAERAADQLEEVLQEHQECPLMYDAAQEVLDRLPRDVGYLLLYVVFVKDLELQASWQMPAAAMREAVDRIAEDGYPFLAGVSR